MEKECGDKNCKFVKQNPTQNTPRFHKHGGTERFITYGLKKEVEENRERLNMDIDPQCDAPTCDDDKCSDNDSDWCLNEAFHIHEMEEGHKVTFKNKKWKNRNIPEKYGSNNCRKCRKKCFGSMCESCTLADEGMDSNESIQTQEVVVPQNGKNYDINIKTTKTITKNIRESTLVIEMQYTAQIMNTIKYTYINIGPDTCHSINNIVKSVETRTNCTFDNRDCVFEYRHKPHCNNFTSIKIQIMFDILNSYGYILKSKEKVAGAKPNKNAKQNKNGSVLKGHDQEYTTMVYIYKKSVDIESTVVG